MNENQHNLIFNQIHSEKQQRNSTLTGKTNIPADALSRPPDADQGKEDNHDVTLLPASKFINVANSHPMITHQQKQGLMELIHDHPTAGHPGRDETIRKAKQHRTWPGINQWMRNMSKAVPPVNRTKSSHI